MSLLVIIIQPRKEACESADYNYIQWPRSLVSLLIIIITYSRAGRLVSLYHYYYIQSCREACQSISLLLHTVVQGGLSVYIFIIYSRAGRLVSLYNYFIQSCREACQSIGCIQSCN